MDVRLPDGTVIQNVPDDFTKAQLAQKLQANGYDISKLRSEAPAPTAGDRGMALGAGVQRSGVAGLVGLPVDTIESVANLGLAGIGSLAAAAGRPDLAPSPLHGSYGGSEYIAKNLRERGHIGLPGTNWLQDKIEGATGLRLPRAAVDNPRPDDATSRMLYTGGNLLGGSVGMPPAQALASAASGAVAGEVLGPQWVGPASMVPAAAGQAWNAGKQAIADRVRPNVEQFRAAGAEPSVGQATDSAFMHGIENLLSKYPGGAEIMQKFAKNQQERFGEGLQSGVTAEKAGRVIEKGITGEGGFLERTRNEWRNLDQKMADKIGGPYNIPPVNTQATLDRLANPIPGSATAQSLVNPKIAQIREAFQTDLKNGMGALPFEDVRALRSKVGSMLDDALVTGIPGGEIKQVYGALSKDMQAAAEAVGAGKEFARQQKYYSARMDRIQSVLDQVVGKNPEDVFKKVMPTNSDQASTVTATMRSLNHDERLVVTDAVVNRLGRATPGQQNELGDVFSTNTFLTNWNKMSGRAKSQFFPDELLREGLNKLAAVSTNIREGSKGFTNPAGTAGAFAAYGVYSAPFIAIGQAIAGAATAGLGTIATAVGSVAAANISAKMMTNPKIVDWLAASPRVKPDQAAAHLAKLGVIYNQIDDPQLKQDLGQFVNSINGK